MKQRLKQGLRRTIGEPYVGKRLKLRSVSHALRAADLQVRSIVDAGAEDATFVYWLADRYPEATVTAIDIDRTAMAACEAARPRRYNGRVSFRVGTFEDLPPESTDLIVAFDVLEHITDDAAVLSQFHRAIRPGGSLIIHVPRDRWRRADGAIERVPDDEAWRINPGHVRMGYAPERLAELVTGAGFDVVEVQTWVRTWGVRAFSLYHRLERFGPARLLTVPFTDLAAALDRRRPADEGNTVWLRARRS
ncbi:MAG: class I SAM-dependent methyltransferase [Acidimicrobiia bacterium]